MAQGLDLQHFKLSTIFTSVCGPEGTEDSAVRNKLSTAAHAYNSRPERRRQNDSYAVSACLKEDQNETRSGTVQTK